jgi:hypothetical protein
MHDALLLAKFPDAREILLEIFDSVIKDLVLLQEAIEFVA